MIQTNQQYPMKPIIEITDLCKKFGRKAAIDGVQLEVPEGSIIAFLGPNGAGKTTTIKCMLNLHTPNRGTVQILGKDSRRLGPQEFEKIGYVSENQELPLWMTVQQYLDFCRPMYPTWDVPFCERMVKSFDLPLSSKIKSLSRGMRMKAALLSSLVYRPRLVILDEPFSGLDPLVREEFIRGLLELTEEEGWTVFISSHDIEEVERLADRVAVIADGRIQLHESAVELQERFRQVEITLPDEKPLACALPKEWLRVERSGRALRFVDAHFDEHKLTVTISTLTCGAKLLEATPMSLRSIFIALAHTYRMASSNSN
jgi:ABC-2 type transport system ATP-binding protein